MIVVLAHSVYNYFRDYDPSIGRYAQSDPIGMGGGVNTYTYVANRPMNFIDRIAFRMTGLCDAISFADTVSYERRRKEIVNNYDKSRDSASETKNNAITNCLTDNRNCETLKASQCLPEEDCDFSFGDCVNDAYDTFDTTVDALLIKLQTDMQFLINTTIGAGPGANNGCPPI